MYTNPRGKRTQIPRKLRYMALKKYEHIFLRNIYFWESRVTLILMKIDSPIPGNFRNNVL